MAASCRKSYEAERALLPNEWLLLSRAQSTGHAQGSSVGRAVCCEEMVAVASARMAFSAREMRSDWSVPISQKHAARTKLRTTGRQASASHRGHSLHRSSGHDTDQRTDPLALPRIDSTLHAAGRVGNLSVEGQWEPRCEQRA